MFVDFDTVRHLWPEVVLVLLATMIYVGGAFQKHQLWWTLFALAGYAVAAFAVLSNATELWPLAEFRSGTLASGPIVVDYLGDIFRLAAIFVGVFFTLVAARTVSAELATEFLGTLMLLVVGVMLVARANDLVLLFVGLELISIPTYVLLYLGRRDRATSEAAAKYFFLSIFSSAFLLYGVSFVYGLTGTTTLMSSLGNSVGRSLASLASSGPSSPLLLVATVLVAGGLGFKLAAVPFHFYAPDVYQGATNGNAGLLAVAPKLGGLAALIRLLVIAMPDGSRFAWQMLLVVSIATMTLGNICALWQKNLRRLMAFSSIAHAGYMLIGITVALATTSHGYNGGVSSAVLYVIVYSLAVAGTFAALAYLGGVQREINNLEDIAGLGSSQPLVAAAIAVCMFSLAGIPPLAGFWGKLTLFTGAIRAASESTASSGSGLWMVILAIVGAVNAAIAAAYYLRVVAVMYFGVSHREHGGEGGWGAKTAMIIATALVLVAGIFPGTLTTSASRADQWLSRPQRVPTANNNDGRLVQFGGVKVTAK